MIAMDDAADSYIDIAKAVWQQIEKFLSAHEMTNESFDSSDPTLSRVFIGWLKENLNY
ncbi:hypothetical protein AB3538_08185 [Acinetobacter baumannii]